MRSHGARGTKRRSHRLTGHRGGSSRGDRASSSPDIPDEMYEGQELHSTEYDTEGSQRDSRGKDSLSESEESHSKDSSPPLRLRHRRDSSSSQEHKTPRRSKQERNREASRKTREKNRARESAGKARLKSLDEEIIPSIERELREVNQDIFLLQTAVELSRCPRTTRSMGTRHTAPYNPIVSGTVDAIEHVPPISNLGEETEDGDSTESTISS